MPRAHFMFRRYDINKSYDHCDPCGNAYERGQLTEFDSQLFCPVRMVQATVRFSH